MTNTLSGIFRRAMMIALGTCVLAGGGGQASAGWLYGYAGGGFREKLTVTNRAHLAADLADAQVAVHLALDSAHTTPDGSDIRFTAGDGETLLDFDRERHVVGEQLYWVKLPKVKAAEDTEFYVYFRPTPNGDFASGARTWPDSGYRAVLHMAETNGTTLYDSSASPTNITLGTRTLNAAGKVGLGTGGRDSLGPAPLGLRVEECSPQAFVLRYKPLSP